LAWRKTKEEKERRAKTSETSNENLKEARSTEKVVASNHRRSHSPKIENRKSDGKHQPSTQAVTTSKTIFNYCYSNVLFLFLQRFFDYLVANQ
jgi:hypothetical protein